MNPTFIEARELIAQARLALHSGDKPAARQLGEQAALLVPDMEDAWLILAASDPDPNEALAYAHKALEIRPSSPRARRAVEWTSEQVRQSQVTHQAAVSFARIAPVMEHPQPRSKAGNSKFIYVASFLVLLMCVVLGIAAYSAVTHPALASILKSAAVPTQENHWAPVAIAKASVTPIEAGAFAPPAATATARPTQPATGASTSTATEVPTEAASATPEASETPVTLAMEMVADTATSEYVAPASSAPLPDIAKSGNGVRWIDVDLTHQAAYAYEGDVIVNSFIVSTGTWQYPTVTGQYNIYVKYRYADMHGPGYYLPNVPYVMYFYKSYGLHGTYWHNNFGTPMSHGCVNLRIDDAGWLFNWASIGTLVNVHY